jgi:hypothetical protein
LSPEQLAEIAKKAASARWANRPIQATHKGSFKEHFGIDVDCYVLADDQKTPVLSERGMGRALGLSEGGKSFMKFVTSKNMSSLAGDELLGKFTQPLKFQWGTGGANQPPATIHGFDATLLIDLCQVIVAGERGGSFKGRSAHIANSPR